jgi:hypothetical protein
MMIHVVKLPFNYTESSVKIIILSSSKSFELKKL